MTNEQKAIRQIIRIGSIEAEGFMLPDGSYRMSQSQAAEAIGEASTYALRFLRSNSPKALLGDSYTNYTPESFEVEIEGRGQTRINALPLEVVSVYWAWQSSKGNKKALALVVALLQETLERRFDDAFGVTRSESEYNQRLTDRTRELETALKQIGDGLAFDDDVRMERDRFRQLLEENGIDPYGLPEQT
jgi:hypothetical protein